MSLYKGYSRTNRQKALKLLGIQCQECGSNKYINIHHVDMNPRNNNVNNLQVLCSSCHRLKHTKYSEKTKENRYELKKLIKKKCDKERYMRNRVELGSFTPTPKGYVKSKEACEMLGVSTERLRQLCNDRQKRIKYIYPTSKKIKLYNKESIEKLIKKKS